MSSHPPPPRLARWLIRRVIGGRLAENLIGDLDELWIDRELRGRLAWPDRVWYWRETIGLVQPGTVRALRRGLATRFDRLPRGGIVVLLQDLRFAIRAIAKSPGFAAMTTLTIALGIAGTTTVFSAVDGFVLRPFPFPDQSSLVTVGSAHPKTGVELSYIEHLAPAEFADLRGLRSMDRVVAWDLGNRQVAFGETTENLLTGFWWGDAFSTLGVEPFRGRGFSADELERGEQVAIVSHRVWRDRFGADSSLLGGKLLVNGEPYVVVGIMPPRALVFGTDLWLPMGGKPELVPRDRRMLQVLGRLTSGSTLSTLGAELDGLARRTESAFVGQVPDYAGWRLVPNTWSNATLASLRPAALLLMSATVFVMLLVSTNVATLLLGRSAGRTAEIALRSALGASRGRIFRQLVTESLLLSLLGAAAGIGLGQLGISGINRVLGSLTVSLFDPLALNPRVLLAMTGVALAAGLLFGSIPALHAVRADLRGTIQMGAPLAGNRSRLRLQRVLIGVEAALAIALLAGSGYLLRTFAELRAVDPGFQPERVLTMRLTLARQRYGADAIEPFFATVRERVAALPGVRAVATASQFPPNLFGQREFAIEGATEGASEAKPFAFVTIASPDYFGALGIPLEAGRLLSKEDLPNGPRVAVISSVVRRRFFPGTNPVGQRIRFAANGRWVEIVGVVGETRNRGLDADPAPEVYLPSAQMGGFDNQMFLMVSTRAEPRELLGAIRATVRSLDPDQPIYAVRTIEETYQQGQMARRLSVVIFTLFGAFALALAAVGLYGVVSYATTQRTREIGVRVALGAGHGSVASLFVRQAMIPVLVGTGVGLLAAWAIGLALASLLFQVKPGDWVTMVGATVVLVGTGLVASYVPAKRATRLDPVVTLRQA